VKLRMTINNSSLSKEDRKIYLDEADQFYADPGGFLKKLSARPQRLVFFDSLSPKLGLLRDAYVEVCPRFIGVDVVCTIL